MSKNKQSYTFEKIAQIRSLNHLSYILGLKKKILLNTAKNIEKHYRPFVDRRGKKPRKIDNPSTLLKEIHKRIKDRILIHYPIFLGSLGGTPGKTIKDNAKKHLRKKTVARLDLSDCFHSVSSDKVYDLFLKKFHFSSKVARVLTKISTFNRHVPVGSPLSSTLVNIALDDIWRKSHAVCKASGHELTTWVDDVVISGQCPEKLINSVKNIINANRLKIGWHKLEIMRSNKAQTVTGCTVNHKIGVPKEKRKKYAKSILSPKNNSADHQRIEGQLSYSKYINMNQGKQLSKLLKTLNG